MAGIIIIMIGLFISTVDINAVVLYAYPEYKMVYDDLGLGEIIQKYVADNMLGGNLRLDILPDMLGYVLMAVGAGILIRYNIKFIRVYIPLIITAALHVFVQVTPFIYSGRNLIVYALAASFIQLLAEIYMERKLIYTIADTTSDLPNERDTVLMKFGWIGSALCRAFLYFIVLVGLYRWIIITYQVVQIGFMAFCLHRMYRCRHYLRHISQ